MSGGVALWWGVKGLQRGSVWLLGAEGQRGRGLLSLQRGSRGGSAGGVGGQRGRGTGGEGGRGHQRGRVGGECPVLLHHLDGEVVQLAGQSGCELSQHFLKVGRGGRRQSYRGNTPAKGLTCSLASLLTRTCRDPACTGEDTA